VLVCAIFVAAGDVVVKEGTIEGELFKSTDCTVTGAKGIAFGEQTTAEGDWSTAIGYGTTASGDFSTAMGVGTTASGHTSTTMGYGTLASGNRSTAMGYSTTAGPASYAFALGKYFANNVQDSFAVGFGQKDFSVASGLVTAYGNLYVNGWISGQDLIDRSSFYDKDKYGRALEHLQDSSANIKVNAQGERVYNHDADPEFIRRLITIPDYDKYTEEQVWDNELNCMVPRRNYQTRQELGSSSSAKMAWLTQCVYELKQENEGLKADLAAIKAKLGME
jgi:hypothetical protein